MYSRLEARRGIPLRMVLSQIGDHGGIEGPLGVPMARKWRPWTERHGRLFLSGCLGFPGSELVQPRQLCLALLCFQEALLVVIITPVSVDEALDALRIESIKLIDALPGGQGDACVHTGVWLENNTLVIVLDDLFQLSHQIRATLGAVVVDDHAAILKVVDLEFVGDRFVVHTPACQGAQVRSRGWWGGVVGELAHLRLCDVGIALAGDVLAGPGRQDGPQDQSCQSNNQGYRQAGIQNPLVPAPPGTRLPSLCSRVGRGA